MSENKYPHLTVRGVSFVDVTTPVIVLSDGEAFPFNDATTARTWVKGNAKVNNRFLFAEIYEFQNDAWVKIPN